MQYRISGLYFVRYGERWGIFTTNNLHLKRCYPALVMLPFATMTPLWIIYLDCNRNLDYNRTAIVFNNMRGRSYWSYAASCLQSLPNHIISYTSHPEIVWLRTLRGKVAPGEGFFQRVWDNLDLPQCTIPASRRPFKATSNRPATDMRIVISLWLKVVSRFGPSKFNTAYKKRATKVDGAKRRRLKDYRMVSLISDIWPAPELTRYGHSPKAMLTPWL